jgi:anion-transporting  ArsA/GET3 family ATPase
VQRAVAQPRHSVTVLSTDPGHSLADVFQVSLKDAPMRVALPELARLFLWQIDAARQFNKFIGKYRSGILD